MTIVPCEPIVPMARALIDGCRIVAVAHFNNQRLLISSQDKVKGHALRTDVTSHFESDLDAFWADSPSIINNVPAAGGAKVTRAHVTCKGERSIANDGHPRVELVTRNEVLKVDVPSLAP